MSGPGAGGSGPTVGSGPGPAVEEVIPGHKLGSFCSIVFAFFFIKFLKQSMFRVLNQSRQFKRFLYLIQVLFEASIQLQFSM